jgi:hypothetical protein
VIFQTYDKHGRDGSIERAEKLIDEIKEIIGQPFGGVEV